MIVAWNTAQSIGSVSQHNTDKRIRVISMHDRRESMGMCPTNECDSITHSNPGEASSEKMGG